MSERKERPDLWRFPCATSYLRCPARAGTGEEALATGELAVNRRDKIFEAKAELKDSTGKILASAAGKYLPIKPVELADMSTDLVGDPAQILSRPS